MLTTWMFFFGCVLCLMFLGMLYGEQLSLVGLFDGRWLSPIARAFYGAWTELCRGLDDTVEFVREHASWVLATASGTAGLTIIAFLMFSGLASDASAVHRDEATPMRQGGVLDAVPEISARVTESPFRLTSAAADDSQYVRQMPGGAWTLFSPPKPRPDIDFTPLPDLGPHSWSLTQPELHLSLNRSLLRSPGSDSEMVTLSEGRLIESPPISLIRLRDDGWRMRSGLFDWNPRQPLVSDLDRPALPESTAAEEARLESRVSVLPGESVMSSDLRVEKTWPQAVSSGQVDIEIVLVNTGDQTIQGLLVRELLPFGAAVLDRTPDGTIRDAVITWLVDDLAPFEEVVLTCSVRPPEGYVLQPDDTFESRTEVSAAAAVTSPVTVGPARSVIPPRRGPVIPEIESRPDVRLLIDEPPAVVDVNQTVEVYFNVTNIGDAPADDVQLRVTLDAGLDHHTLTESDIDRRIENEVRRIEPGDTQRLVLRIRATEPGEHLATAEMIFQEAQLVLSTFRIFAVEPLLPDNDVPVPARDRPRGSAGRVNSN